MRFDDDVEDGRERERSGIDRKRFLVGLAGVPAWLAVAGCSGEERQTRGGGGGEEPSGAGGAPESGGPPGGAETFEARVERVLREYDAQGIHRTGTEVDERCARWLADEARRLGAQSELEEMPFDRIDILEAYADLGGERFEGVPLFDAPFTGPEGISGKLVAAAPGTETELGYLLDVSPDAAGGKAFLEHRRKTAQRGLIAVTRGESFGLAPGLALLNAESYEAPYGSPVIQLSSEARARVEAAGGSDVRFVTHAARRDVVAYNTLASVPGQDPTLPPLGVMTPRSGWWQCASERGGGIAVWIEVLAAVAAAQPARTVNFVASTGHELGHLGLSHYLATRRDQVAGTRAWLHLGANFTAAIAPRVRMQFSDEELRRIALDALARHGLAPDSEAPVGQTPIGEARNVADGGRYISILGSNGRFHQPSDRYPEAVDLPKAIAFAKAYAEIALALASA